MKNVKKKKNMKNKQKKKINENTNEERKQAKSGENHLTTGTQSKTFFRR